MFKLGEVRSLSGKKMFPIKAFGVVVRYTSLSYGHVL